MRACLQRRITRRRLASDLLRCRLMDRVVIDRPPSVSPEKLIHVGEGLLQSNHLKSKIAKDRFNTSQMNSRD